MAITLGQKVAKATIVGIKEIVNHGKFYTNTKVISEITTKGARGGYKKYSLLNDGRLIFVSRVEKEWAHEGHAIYNGTSGKMLDVLYA